MNGRWLSYDEMAVALRMTPASARRLVGKKKWPRKIGNDGRALVCVPPERLAAAAHPAAGEAARGDVNPGASLGVRATSPGAGEGAEEDGGAGAAPAALGIEVELLTRLATLHGELAEIARKLGAAEGELSGLKIVLEAERKLAAEQIALFSRQLDEVRADRDAWRNQAQAAHRLLPDQRPRRGFLARLMRQIA